MVTMDRAVLFMNEQQVGDAVRAHLGDHVEIQPYDTVFSQVDTLKSSLTSTRKKVRRCERRRRLSSSPYKLIAL